MKDGARVLLERGSAIALVHHGKTSSWLFVAGPFEVHVVGTRFNLTWDPSKEEVNLALDEGAVELKSPLGQGPFVVRKGQKFHASLLTQTVRMEDKLSPTPSASQTIGTPEQFTAPATEPAKIKSPLAHYDSWQRLVTRGRFQNVVAAAEARGIDNCLNSCSILDIRALADAARYVGRTDLAERGLVAIRQRASGGSQRSAAAFLLGRTSESRDQVSIANTWYDTYLTESPNGEFAADALAGKMRVAVWMHGSAAAKPLAMQYLQRYPSGVHVDTARKIAGIN
jgi:hypothetical protein